MTTVISINSLIIGHCLQKNLFVSGFVHTCMHEQSDLISLKLCKICFLKYVVKCLHTQKYLRIYSLKLLV